MDSKMEFPNKEYNIIYADPPWSFRRKKTGGGSVSGAAQKYSVMTPYDICRLPVDKIATNDCVLIMWWVGSQPTEALGVMAAWGFKLKTMTGFVWNKKTKHGKPHFGMGNWTRAGSECCLIATKGKPKRALGNIRSVVEASVGRHSEKPAIIADEVVKLCGDLPRIELFARDRKTGWDSWGNEI